ASGAVGTVVWGGSTKPAIPGVSGSRAAPLPARRRARVRQGARLLRRPVGVRAAHVRARGGRGGPRPRGVHAGLLPPRAGPVRRDHRHEAGAHDAEEPEAAKAPRAVPGRAHQALLQARHRAAGTAIPPRPRLLTVAPLRLAPVAEDVR